MAVIRYSGPFIITMNDEKLWATGHLINNWTRNIAAQWTRASRLAAPLNKRNRKFPGAPPRGSLRAGISSEVNREATRVLGITHSSKAPYTIYVHQGTRPVIYARDIGGRFAKAHFRLPRNNFGPYKIVSRIRGQSANPFMYEGLRAVARRHPALAGAGRLITTAPLLRR